MIEDVVQQRNVVWNNFFGLMPLTEEKEKEDKKEKLDNIEYLYYDVEQLVEIMEKMAQDKEKQTKKFIIEDGIPATTLLNVTLVSIKLEKIVSIEKDEEKVPKSIKDNMMDTTNPLIVKIKEYPRIGEKGMDQQVIVTIIETLRITINCNAILQKKKMVIDIQEQCVLATKEEKRDEVIEKEDQNTQGHTDVQKAQVDNSTTDETRQIDSGPL